MSVVGVGVDVIEVGRVRTALTRTPRLARRLFTDGERAACVSGTGGPRYASLAARFAAKEAVGKALGTGIRGFRWLDVEVAGDDLGKPQVCLHEGAAASAAGLGVTTVHLSLSTSADLAVASVVLEGESAAAGREER